jgi:predicted AlkP superfamily phosphohydrolase/phosphomutase
MLHLLHTNYCDLFFGVFSISDWIGHVLWKYIDPSHPLYDSKRSDSVKRKFNELWQKIDSVIGELLGFLPTGTDFLIVSDHGMGQLTSVFYPNSWLHQMGWLQKKNLGLKGFIAEKLQLFSEGFDNKYTHSILYHIKSKLLKIHGTMDFIDYDRSLAYSPEHNTMFGCFNLTRKGKDSVNFKEKLIEAIKSLPNEYPGISNVKVYLPEEIYTGPYVNLAPDIFFIVNDYKSTVEIGFSPSAFVDKPSIDLRTGGHRTDGIFIAKGKHFRQDTEIKVSILDIAPTVISLFKLPIPSSMDGKIIIDAIRPELITDISSSSSNYEPEEDIMQKGMKKGDLEDMKKMLNSLGYL